jgi:hypothetical protein
VCAFGGTLVRAKRPWHRRATSHGDGPSRRWSCAPGLRRRCRRPHAGESSGAMVLLHASVVVGCLRAGATPGTDARSPAPSSARVNLPGPGPVDRARCHLSCMDAGPDLPARVQAAGLRRHCVPQGPRPPSGHARGFPVSGADPLLAESGSVRRADGNTGDCPNLVDAEVSRGRATQLVVFSRARCHPARSADGTFGISKHVPKYLDDPPLGCRLVLVTADCDGELVAVGLGHARGVD